MIDFSKYHGTGNDFILINGDRFVVDQSDHEWIRRCCDRRFGIGADGLIVVKSHEDFDFEMIFFNSNGQPGSFCGNGSRCAVLFARAENLFSGNQCRFLAYDGSHEAVIQKEESVEIKMSDVTEVEAAENYVVLDTGSPHYVEKVTDLPHLNIGEAGKAIRYSPRFAEKGINVNFVEWQKDGMLHIATYERGVEDETLSCGTGVVASVLGVYVLEEGPEIIDKIQKVRTKGGDLKVRFSTSGSQLENIWLIGPAEFIFSGQIQNSSFQGS